MKAILQHAYGSPDVLELRDIDRPAVKDDEVLVRVRAAAVNIGRAEANRVLGSERVFGWGARARPQPNAELLTEVVWREGEWWASSVRELDPKIPLADSEATPVRLGWWMDSPSFADRLRRASSG
jgi:hypothetical protein